MNSSTDTTVQGQTTPESRAQRHLDGQAIGVQQQTQNFRRKHAS